ncbi:hypothetical protein TNCV_251731 [Trichonephila clavipes]|nr:hypothetical protein TNCV_251731 [Trichonephila clavipes]
MGTYRFLTFQHVKKAKCTGLAKAIKLEGQKTRSANCGGEKWKTRRKLLAPCFHSHLLRSLVTVMNKEAITLVKRLQEETDKDYTDIGLLLSLCTMYIICGMKRIFIQMA